MYIILPKKGRKRRTQVTYHHFSEAVGFLSCSIGLRGTTLYPDRGILGDGIMILDI